MALKWGYHDLLSLSFPSCYLSVFFLGLFALLLKTLCCGEQYCYPDVRSDSGCENSRPPVHNPGCTCPCGLQVTWGLRFGEGAHDLDVGEEDHSAGTCELGSGSPEAVGAPEGDLGLDGLQHHHVGVHVRDADTHIFPEAPGETQ